MIDVCINQLNLVRGYWFDATAAKNWKLQNFYKFLAREKIGKYLTSL